MLRKYWDRRGIIHFEFLNHNRILNADLYTQQLQQVHKNLRKRSAFVNRRNVVLLYDNEKQNLARITYGKYCI